MEGGAYDAGNKDFYSKIFQLTNVIIAGPYVNKFSRTKYGCKAYFSICQKFMGFYAINRAREKAYLAMESAKYYGKSQQFTYETYVLFFENNMRILFQNNE